MSKELKRLSVSVIMCWLVIIMTVLMQLRTDCTRSSYRILNSMTSPSECHSVCVVILSCRSAASCGVIAQMQSLAARELRGMGVTGIRAVTNTYLSSLLDLLVKQVCLNGATHVLYKLFIPVAPHAVALLVRCQRGYLPYITFHICNNHWLF